jgi:hypothetical protein
MRRKALFGGLAVLAIVALIPIRTARAQTSDSLVEDLFDSNSDPLTITNPQNFSLPEGPNESNATPITIAARDFDMMENSTTISDRLHIDSFTISAPSDTDDPTTGQDIPLPRRQGATLIPASALENLLPIAIVVSSDGDPTQAGAESDHIKITEGFYGGNTGTVVVDQSLPELAQETASEVYLINIPAIKFDVEEPGSTGGSIISDYVDVSAVTGVFRSSDTQTDYPKLTNGPNAQVMESPGNGQQLTWDMDFSSDVPEPASMGLLCAASALFLRLRRRQSPDPAVSNR